jgi:hypothetical protein
MSTLARAMTDYEFVELVAVTPDGTPLPTGMIAHDVFERCHRLGARIARGMTPGQIWPRLRTWSSLWLQRANATETSR